MRYELAGLGSAQTTQIVASGVAVGGSTTGAILAATGVVGGPIGIAIGAAASVVAMLIGKLFQPNLQKIQASNDANQIEQYLKQNLANWLSLPDNQKYYSVQQAALQVFDAAWQQYVNLVQQIPDWKSKAPNSISDRQSGSCAYHTAQPAGWSGGNYIPNGPNQNTGACWNWFIGYRDPIANDPNVIPDPTPDSQIAQQVSSLIGSPNSNIWLLLGLFAIIGGLYVATR